MGHRIQSGSGLGTQEGEGHEESLGPPVGRAVNRIAVCRGGVAMFALPARGRAQAGAGAGGCRGFSCRQPSCARSRSGIASLSCPTRASKGGSSPSCTTSSATLSASAAARCCRGRSGSFPTARVTGRRQPGASSEMTWSSRRCARCRRSCSGLTCCSRSTVSAIPTSPRACSVPSATIGTRIHRARQKLRVGIESRTEGNARRAA